MAERPIGFWLKLVDRLIDERFVAIIEEHGVTRRQWQLLSRIAGGETTVEQLDASIAPFVPLGVTETSADHLGELIESEWLVLSGNEYELTERGRIAHDRLGEVVHGLRSTAADGIAEADYAATLAALERMARNLGYAD